MELKKALQDGHNGPQFWGRVHPKVRLLILKGYVGNKPAFSAGSRRADWRGKSLVPAGKHLDGSDLPAVGDVLWKVSKLLSTDGEHHAYYLNEHRTFNVFAKMHCLKTCRLLSVKGSRQNLTVQQATRVLRNVPAYCTTCMISALSRSRTSSSKACGTACGTATCLGPFVPALSSTWRSRLP